MTVKLDAGCMWDGRKFNGGIRDKITSVGAGFAYLIGRMGISFKLTTGFGMQDEKHG